jgi:dihydroorotate dehydrogenase electron transfer subunit
MKVRVLDNRPAGGGCFSLTFEWPMVDARPGQFVMLRVSEQMDPLLRRPMSIASQNGDMASIIFKPVGSGTRMLSHLKLDDELDVIGPFGNSFRQPDSDGEVVLVGGGVGIPPLLFFAERNRGTNITVIIGGATINDILSAEEFADSGAKVIITTEDGSMGSRGVVTGALKKLKTVKEGSARLIACGPPGMLKAVDRLAVKFGIEGQLSLEETMGCGFGVCLGCMVETGNGRKRVCEEGPVFKTGTIKWRRISR